MVAIFLKDCIDLLLESVLWFVIKLFLEIRLGETHVLISCVSTDVFLSWINRLLNAWWFLFHTTSKSSCLTPLKTAQTDVLKFTPIWSQPKPQSSQSFSGFLSDPLVVYGEVKSARRNIEKPFHLMLLKALKVSHTSRNVQRLFKPT